MVFSIKFKGVFVNFRVFCRTVSAGERHWLLQRVESVCRAKERRDHGKRRVDTSNLRFLRIPFSTSLTTRTDQLCCSGLWRFQELSLAAWHHASCVDTGSCCDWRRRRRCVQVGRVDCRHHSGACVSRRATLVDLLLCWWWYV